MTTTRYDRMRAAADTYDSWFTESDCACDYCEKSRKDPSLAVAKQLRADADELEAVEREMRSDNPSYTVWAISNGQADDWADRIRGEK